MAMNSNEIWTAIYGMVFGEIFLPGFSGALYAVYSMNIRWNQCVISDLILK